MAKNNNLTDFLTDTANAIRTKKGTTGKINPQDFSSEIANIQTGTDTSDATATADDILLGKTAYANGAKLTGTLEIGASGTPIDVATEEEMASILSNATSDDNGKIYRYTGTTGTYVNGALYWLEVPLVTK